MQVSSADTQLVSENPFTLCSLSLGATPVLVQAWFYGGPWSRKRLVSMGPSAI